MAAREVKEQGRQHDKTVRIRADVATVWRALTDAEEITRWFAPDARVTPGTGGKIWLSWGAGAGEGESTIEIWDPGKRLRTLEPPREALAAAEGQAAAAPRGPIAVDYFLEGHGGETVLRLVHSGFGSGADWDDEFHSTNHGWDIFLGNLKHYLERRPGLPCVQAFVALPCAVAPETAWQRLLGDVFRGTNGKLPDRVGAVCTFVNADAQREACRVEEIAAPTYVMASSADGTHRIGFSLDRFGGQALVFAYYYGYGVAPEAGERIKASWTETLTAALAA